jgi:hypothetical protein
VRLAPRSDEVPRKPDAQQSQRPRPGRPGTEHTTGAPGRRQGPRAPGSRSVSSGPRASLSFVNGILGRECFATKDLSAESGAGRSEWLTLVVSLSRWSGDRYGRSLAATRLLFRTCPQICPELGNSDRLQPALTRKIARIYGI